jgi:mycofactocin system FadH/OYE family oxidoreductase 1
MSRPSYRLAEPVAVGALEAPSRVVFGPHETNLARGRAISPAHVAYYARRAAGGTGVIVIETASVADDDWPYERAPLAGDCRPGWQSVASACRPHRTLLLAGLGHAGGQGSSAFSQQVMWAPSRVADVVTREPPAELDQDGIDALVAAFSWAAVEAVSAGLDGVEIDSGVWSLLRQFQSGLTNQRSDEYGQDRLRFTREVVAAVRRAVGTDRVLALRMSCDELAPWAGITPEQAAEAAAALAPGVDLLTVVRGGPYSTSAYRPDAHTPPNFNLDLCRFMKEATDGATRVALQGSVVEADDADDAVIAGVADLVEMTRAQIAEPRLVARLRSGSAERTRPCLLCNQACRVRDNRNPIVSCVGEPAAGHEVEEPDEPLRDPGGPRVMVVGAGPAGLECARFLAESGRQVAVCDRAPITGGTPVLAAVGTGRERIRLLSEWLATECRRSGVEFFLETEVTAEDVRAAWAEGWEVVLATGSRPFPERYSTNTVGTEPGGEPGGEPVAGREPEADGEPAGAGPVVIDGLQLLLSAGAGPAARDGLPSPAGLAPGPVVIDDPVGDQVAVGIAEWLAARKTGPVTLVSPDPVAGTLLALTGDLADANVRLQRAGVNRQLRSRVISVGTGHVEVEDVWTGERTRLPAASLVDCGHRLAEDSLYRQLEDPAVLRAGDCVAPRTLLSAVLEGRRAAVELLRRSFPVEAHA